MIWVEMEIKNVGDMHIVALFGSTSESASCWIAQFYICAFCGWLQHDGMVCLSREC